jgi:hypothetical protein
LANNNWQKPISGILLPVLNAKIMSTREIHSIIYQLGIFLFRGGSINEGMLVARYNISEARIEYYFIHTSRVNEYRAAKNAYDSHAHIRLGNRIEEASILRAEIFN